MRNKTYYSLPVLAMSAVCSATEHPSHMSYAGYTGLFNTPNAEILEKGVIDIGYNNQLDQSGLKYVDGHNYIFSAGVFDGLEVSGVIASNTMHDNMFAEGRGQLRDLSFNLKYQIPYIPKEWFNLAIGAANARVAYDAVVR